MKSPDYVPIQFVKKGIDMTVDRRRLLAGVPAAVVGSALFARAATAPEEAGSYDVVGMTCHGFAVTHLDA